MHRWKTQRENGGATIVILLTWEWSKLSREGVTCNACRIIGHFERTYRGLRRETNRWRGRGQVCLIRDENEHHRSTHGIGSSRMNEEQVGRFNQHRKGGEEISSSDEYMVMSIMEKNRTELKIPNARLQAEVSGTKMWFWMDSGSPVTIINFSDL